MFSEWVSYNDASSCLHPDQVREQSLCPEAQGPRGTVRIAVMDRQNRAVLWQ